MLTQFPSPEERPHREPRHRQVPGGGAVQGCQLRAAAGGAEVLGAEVDHQKRDQARAALTPAPGLPPTQTPRAWDSHPELLPRAGCALTQGGWDLPPAGVWLGPVPWDGGLPACSGGRCRDRPPPGAEPSQLGSLTATPTPNHVPFPRDSCPAARTATFLHVLKPLYSPQAELPPVNSEGGGLPLAALLWSPQRTPKARRAEPLHLWLVRREMGRQPQCPKDSP